MHQVGKRPGAGEISQNELWSSLVLYWYHGELRTVTYEKLYFDVYIIYSVIDLYFSYYLTPGEFYFTGTKQYNYEKGSLFSV